MKYLRFKFWLEIGIIFLWTCYEHKSKNGTGLKRDQISSQVLLGSFIYIFILFPSCSFLRNKKLPTTQFLSFTFMCMRAWVIMEEWKMMLKPIHITVVLQLLSCVWLFMTPWTAALQASLSFTISLSLLKLMPIEFMMPSNHLVICCPPNFPSFRFFSNESSLNIRWPNYWSFSFSISPSNIQHWLTGFILCSPKDSRVFSNTTFQKHQFFGAQPSLWFNSHIHTWLLEKP